jgi:hypothetical protein
VSSKIKSCCITGRKESTSDSKSIRHYSYDSYPKIMVIKYVEETDNCEAARK